MIPMKRALVTIAILIIATTAIEIPIRGSPQCMILEQA